MDPITAIDIAGDSTFALMLEAQARSHKLFCYTPEELSMLDGQVVASGTEVVVRDVAGDHFEQGERRRLNLGELDVVLLRQDPPFNMAYITSTHLLERVPPSTFVVNNPYHVRNAPEKLFVTEFKELVPPTLITSQMREVEAFRQKHGDIIIKPLYGNGGAGVFLLKCADDNIGALIEMFREMFVEPFVVQKYLPEVRNGDKRVILIDGEPTGAVNRVPSAGETRSNLHIGGKAMATELTQRDREICTAIGPALRQRGLLFAGIDIIGNYLTEINVTSPTGIRQIKNLQGVDISPTLWDAIENRRVS
jgi:glutathione synthase